MVIRNLAIGIVPTSIAASLRSSSRPDAYAAASAAAAVGGELMAAVETLPQAVARTTAVPVGDRYVEGNEWIVINAATSTDVGTCRPTTLMCFGKSDGLMPKIRSSSGRGFQR